MTATKNQLIEHALQYGWDGWPVIALKGGKPLVSWTPYQTDLPTDAEIAGWPWGRADGMALVIGAALWKKQPGLWVLDAEVEHRAEAEAWLDAHVPKWRAGRVAESGRGGLHVYFRAPGPVATDHDFPWGDVQGNNALAVLPPSTSHKSGKSYRWLSEGEIIRLRPEKLPGYKASKPPLRELLSEPIAQGDRNETLFRLGSKLRGAGLDIGIIESTLQAINADWCRPPLDRDEVRTVAQSTGRYEPDPQLVMSPNGKASDNADDDLPAFPVDVLPEPFRSLVREGAAASDIDPAFVALPVLAIAGGLIGPTVRIELKRGWNETAQLWLAVIAQPGRGKTPGEKHARQGLEKLQAEAHKSYERKLEAYEVEVAEWLRSEGGRGPKPQPPQMTSFYSADATMEALTAMLAVRSGLVVLRDELVSWVRSCDAYRGGRGGDRSAWLSLWSGVPVKVDRKTGKPIYITDPVVSVAGGIQPEMLPALAEEANRRDGFIERMVFAFPIDHVPGWTEDEISQATADAVNARMGRLAKLESQNDPIRLGPSARETWREWFAENTEAQGHVHGILGGIYAKLPIQLARLTLLLHALEATSNQSFQPFQPEVESSTVARAIQLVEYFRAHAHRVVPYFGEAATTIPGLTPERQRILNYHREYGPATSKDVAEHFEMNADSVNNMHRSLWKKGHLVRVAHGFYDAPPPPEEKTTSGWNDGNDWNQGGRDRDFTSDETSAGSEIRTCERCGSALPPHRAKLCDACIANDGRS